MALTIRHRQGERRDRVEFRAQAGAGSDGLFQKKTGFKSVGSVHSSEQLTLNQRVQGSSPCAPTRLK